MNSVTRRGFGWGFALGAMSTAIVAVGLWASPSARAAKPVSLSRDMFDRTLDQVLDRYVDPVDKSALLERALQHALTDLDPHSHFLSADERRALEARSRGGTTGMIALLEKGAAGTVLNVVVVRPDTPAAEAGFAQGDQIVAIDGVRVETLRGQTQIDALMSGAPDDTVQFDVIPAGQTPTRRRAVQLVRDQGADVVGKLIPVDGGAVACVHVRAFSAGVGERVKNTLARLRRSAAGRVLSGVVLDVRSNPGGQVDEALVVADLFVARGILTRTRGRGGTILREEKAHARGTDEKTPLVVVQDRRSASAAELLAAALADHGRATIVGEQSYGKGTVQERRGLEDGSLLSFTIARYYSPDDRMIDGVGVTPDVAATMAPGDDAGALSAALRALGLRRKP